VPRGKGPRRLRRPAAASLSGWRNKKKGASCCQASHWRPEEPKLHGRADAERNLCRARHCRKKFASPSRPGSDLRARTIKIWAPVACRRAGFWTLGLLLAKTEWRGRADTPWQSGCIIPYSAFKRGGWHRPLAPASSSSIAWKTPLIETCWDHFAGARGTLCETASRDLRANIWQNVRWS